MSVFALPPRDPGLRPYVLPGEAGVVLGRLFKADLTNPHLGTEGQLDQPAAREIVRTAGQHLSRHFWGGYVAFVRDHEARCAYAIRDCSGKIPCYYTRWRDITILFADLSDLTPLELPPFTVNWEYLAAFVYSSQLQVRACALTEVTELLSGDCLEVRAGSVRQTTLWDPRTICRERRIDRYEDAVRELKEVTQRCIDAWAQTYDPILHSLSGGFDSSAALGWLSQSPAHPQITCLYQFPAATCDDERRYARLAAERAGVPLLEVPMHSAAERFDSRLLSGPRMPKPSVPGLFRLPETELINRIAAATGARTLWTGQGGDQLFLQTEDSSSAADFLAIHGPRLGFIAAVRDAARVSRQPYWFVLRSSCKPDRSSGPAAPRSRPSYLVNPAALPNDAEQYVAHPWETGAEDLPRGKRIQIRLLGNVVNRHRPVPRFERAPQHHPLLSQPLLEVCLQIPTYLLIRGGRARALARDAFSDRVPTEIIRRLDKGSIVSHTTEMLRESQEFVRELLLEGVLAGARIIDRGDLEPYIVHGQPFREDHLLPLLACVAAEVWARTCTSSDVAIAGRLGTVALA